MLKKCNDIVFNNLCTKFNNKLFDIKDENFNKVKNSNLINKSKNDSNSNISMNDYSELEYDIDNSINSNNGFINNIRGKIISDTENDSN